MLTHELDDVVTELARRHPRFRRVTIERLVARTACGCHLMLPEMVADVVRREANDQLSYVDGGPVGDHGVPGAWRTLTLLAQQAMERTHRPVG